MFGKCVKGNVRYMRTFNTNLWIVLYENEATKYKGVTNSDECHSREGKKRKGLQYTMTSPITIKQKAP